MDALEIRIRSALKTLREVKAEFGPSMKVRVGEMMTCGEAIKRAEVAIKSHGFKREKKKRKKP